MDNDRGGIALSWLQTPPLQTVIRRLPQCVFGVSLVGVALTLLVRARFGLGPWEVLSDGIHHRSGLALGTAGIIVGAITVLLWIPLRQPVGVGTFTAVVVFGLVVNAVLPYVPDASGLARRIAYLVAAITLWGFGIAVYLSAGLGPGPRDGIMTALVRRGHSVRLVRTVKEVIVLAIGASLGGSAGIGTVVYAFGIGSCIQFFLSILPKAAKGP